jgi:hypothetical protein
MWTCLLVATICSLQFSGAPLCQTPITSQSSLVAAAVPRRQTEAEATRPELTSALSRLKARQKIRVEALNVHRIEGRFLRVVGDTLVVGKEEKDLITPTPVPIVSIQSLQVEKDGKTVGAIMGGFFGAIFFAALSAAGTGSGDRFVSEGEAALVGGVFGAVIGTVVGLAIGSTAKHWKPVYPEP